MGSLPLPTYLSDRFHKPAVQLLLLLLVTACIYAPSLGAEISAVDDAHWLQILEHRTSWSLSSIFLPSASGGIYYRPVVFLSFVVDKFFAGFDPLWLHLENLLFHLCNVGLVFAVARSLEAEVGRNDARMPLLAALLFASHPLATESVCWISGRSDLLAGLGVFAAALMLLRFRNDHRYRWLFMAAGVWGVGVLAKESALAFLPLGLYLIWGGLSVAQDKWAKSGIIALVAMGLVAGVIALRHLAFESDASSLALTLQSLEQSPMHGFMIMLRSLAFYLKKMFAPWPLNFAIVDVDPLYELAAIPLLIFLVWLGCRRALAARFFLGALLMFFPAFIIVINQISWAPYAERYLYLSLGLGIWPVVHYFRTMVARPSERILTYLLVAGVVIAFTVTTFQRCVVWQTNLALLEDTATKSPTSSRALIAYGKELSLNSRFADAMQVFKQAQALPVLGYNPQLEIAIAEAYWRQGKWVATYTRLRDAVDKGEGDSLVVVKSLLEFMSSREGESFVAEGSAFLREYCHTGGSAACYGSGLLAEQRHDYRQALFYYGQVGNTWDVRLRRKAKDGARRMQEADQ